MTLVPLIHFVLLSYLPFGRMRATLDPAAVVAGEAQWLIAPAASVAGQIKGGRLRALGITSKRRSPLMPDVPTIDEAGVPGYEYTSWNAMFAPRKTPRDVILKLHGVLQKILNDAEVRQQYAVQGLSPLGSKSPDEFEKFYIAEYERVARVVKIAGVKPE